MLQKGMTKSEIDAELAKMGDFVKIDHLSRFIKLDLPTDVKRFVCLKMAEIYDKKGMNTEAAKMYNNAAIHSISFADKIKNHLKEAELFIRCGEFERADEAMKKAISHASAKERIEIPDQIKNFYKRQAELYEKEARRGNAVKIYERMLELGLTNEEREEIKKKLLSLYDKLGKVREYMNLNRG